MVALLLSLALTVTGILAGVELAVAVVVNPILRALPFEASIAGRAHGARILGRAMPFWYIASLILVLVATVIVDGASATGASLVAAVFLVLSCVLSVLLLVPINRRARTWTAEEHPADWADQQRRWDRLHLARVGLLVLAMPLLTMSAVIG